MEPEEHRRGDSERAAIGKAELRVGLIGCGAVARDVHLPALEGLDGVEVAGLCDLDRERTRALSERFAVPGFGDASSMLKRGELDVVLITTRPESHAELASAALEAGCHVLVEKPFVYTEREARALVEQAQRQQRRISVVHNYLHHPSVLALRERVAAGEVGEPCSAHFLHGRRDQRYVPDPWYWQTRGSRLGETLPHALYLLLALIPGLELRYAEARRLGRVQLPEHAKSLDTGPDELRVELSAPGGATASVLYSLNTNLPQSLVVVGTRATLQAWIGPAAAVTRWASRGPGSRELVDMARRWLGSRMERWLSRRVTPATRPNSPHERQIRAFLESVQHGGEPPVDEESAVAVVRLWEQVVACYDPAPDGRTRAGGGEGAGA